MRFLLFIAVVFALVSLKQNLAYAQVDITETRTLSFGQAIVTKNDTLYEAVVAPGGSTTSDPEFIFITPPVSGVYRLTGATPFQIIDSVVINVDQQMIGGGQQLNLDNFTFNFPPTVDGAGEATITAGGRMQTNGNGTPYDGPINLNAVMEIVVTLL